MAVLLACHAARAVAHAVHDGSAQPGLNTFKVFREAYLVGGAYPHDSIYLLQHLFNNWFLDLDVGRLCAAAVLIAAVLLAAILLLQKLWGGEDAR